MTYNNLPVFTVQFNENSIWHNVSLVDEPAIEEYLICFSKDVEIKFALNEEKRIVSAPVLIADQLIYRKMNGKEFYIKFDANTIRQFAIDFFRQGKENSGNIQHQTDVEGITFFESYIVDHKRNIAPTEFSDLPDGSWIMSAKIDNDEIWDAIKKGEIKGFSVDMQAAIVPAKDSIDTLEELMEYLNKKNK